MSGTIPGANDTGLAYGFTKADVKRIGRAVKRSEGYYQNRQPARARYPAGGSGGGYQLLPVVLTSALAARTTGATGAPATCTITYLLDTAFAAAKATISGGVITGATLSNQGVGYQAAPTVTITGDGTGASGTATIDADGHVTAITISPGGTGYTEATITLTGGVTVPDLTALGGHPDTMRSNYSTSVASGKVAWATVRKGNLWFVVGDC